MGMKPTRSETRPRMDIVTILVVKRFIFYGFCFFVFLKRLELDNFASISLLVRMLATTDNNELAVTLKKRIKTNGE